MGSLQRFLHPPFFSDIPLKHIGGTHSGRVASPRGRARTRNWAATRLVGIVFKPIAGSKSYPNQLCDRPFMVSTYRSADVSCAADSVFVAETLSLATIGAVDDLRPARPFSADNSWVGLVYVAPFHTEFPARRHGLLIATEKNSAVLSLADFYPLVGSSFPVDSFPQNGGRTVPFAGNCFAKISRDHVPPASTR